MCIYMPLNKASTMGHAGLKLPVHVTTVLGIGLYLCMCEYLYIRMRHAAPSSKYFLVSL